MSRPVGRVMSLLRKEKQLSVYGWILKQAGHEILSAGSVTDALAIIHSMQRFDLLFTDMKLGEDVLGGIRVSEGIIKSRPGLPVLYTSGGVVTEDTRSKFVEPRTFLPKPYARAQLVQAVLDLTRDVK